MLYGRPARIFLIPPEGEFILPVIRTDYKDEPSDAEMANAATSDDQSCIASVIRSCIGFAQGCPIAMFTSNLPVHIARH